MLESDNKIKKKETLTAKFIISHIKIMTIKSQGFVDGFIKNLHLKTEFSVKEINLFNNGLSFTPFATKNKLKDLVDIETAVKFQPDLVKQNVCHSSTLLIKQYKSK